MTWHLETSKGYEVKKCRHRLQSFLLGAGLDLGCGDEKVVHSAIGIDIEGKAADIKVDLSCKDGLRIFSDDYFDYIFSSHCLEDFYATESTLREWWRKIKPGGYLVLYGPDPDFYPRVGTAGANPNHKHDLYWQDVWKILEGFGNAKKIIATRHNSSNEYSWQMVVQKRYSYLNKLYEGLFKENGDLPIAFPRKKKTNKECLIVRYGALGDAVWMTPVLRSIKEDGYHIVYNCTEYSAQVLRENPHIDEFLIQGQDFIPNEDLDEYWQDIGSGFERYINFCESIERKLLKKQGDDEFDWSHKKRHKECNVNYMDRTLEIAGFPEKKGLLPELYFSKIEGELAQIFLASLKDYFVILWSLSGSALHKVYPWATYVAGEIHKRYEDVKIITVGDDLCRILEWSHPNTICKSGIWTVRQSMIMTKYANLVIGTETGILNAASCYETPKIVLLSHSSVENLTKYWKNCTSLYAKNCNCYPCHRLIYVGRSDICMKTEAKVRTLDNEIVKLNVNHEGAKCMDKIPPKMIFEAFEKYYQEWKKENQNGKVKQEQASQYRWNG